MDAFRGSCVFSLSCEQEPPAVSKYVRALFGTGQAGCVMHSIAKTPTSGEGRILLTSLLRATHFSSVAVAMQHAVVRAKRRLERPGRNGKPMAYINMVLYTRCALAWRFDGEYMQPIADACRPRSRSRSRSRALH